MKNINIMKMKQTITINKKKMIKNIQIKQKMMKKINPQKETKI